MGNEKVVKLLADEIARYESDKPCFEAPDDDWCSENCRYSNPPSVCWIRWAEAKVEEGEECTGVQETGRNIDTERRENAHK